MKIVFDCETLPFSVGNQFPETLFTGYSDGRGVGILAGCLPKLDCEVFGFNVAYDMGCHEDRAWVWHMYDNHRVVDTRINERLHDYAYDGQRREPYSLDACARRRGFAHSLKESEWRTKYSELRGKSPGLWPVEAREYLLQDVKATERLAGRKEAADVRAQSRYDWALKVVSAKGMMVDEEALERLAASISGDVFKHKEVLVEAKLIRGYDHPKSKRWSKDMQAIRDRVVQAGGRRRTEKGAIATSKEALRDLAHKDPILDHLMRYNKASNILGREVKLLRDASLLHVNFDLAVTGRTTSRPNQQNFSKGSGVRECFKPRDGHVFLNCDYPALELRTLAQACKDLLGYDGELLKAFRAGMDPHSAFADEYLSGFRQLAKACNFGFPGGLQGENFKVFAYDQYGLKVDNPDWLRQVWFKKWAEIPHYMREAYRSATWLRGLEHIRSGRVRGRPTRTQACNTFFQGLGADVAKDTLYNIVRACEIGSLRGCYVVAFVHDEFLLECPRGHEAEASRELRRIISETWPKWVPDVPLGDVEVEVKERWTK